MLLETAAAAVVVLLLAVVVLIEPEVAAAATATAADTVEDTEGVKATAEEAVASEAAVDLNSMRFSIKKGGDPDPETINILTSLGFRVHIQTFKEMKINFLGEILSHCCTIQV